MQRPLKFYQSPSETGYWVVSQIETSLDILCRSNVLGEERLSERTTTYFGKRLNLSNRVTTQN